MKKTPQQCFGHKHSDFCPAVLEVNLIRATGDRNERKKNKSKKKKNSQPDQNPKGSEAAAVFIQIVALCRDNTNEDWILGCGFRQPDPNNLSEQHEQRNSDIHEVFFDEQLVFAKLAHVIGAARVRHCSRSEFYRKFLKTAAGGSEATATSAASSGGSRNPSTATRGDEVQELFWRRSVSSGSPSLDSD